MTATYPFINATPTIKVVSATGVHLLTDDGRQILDAAGGAIVVNVGHGRKRVVRAMAEATEKEGYVVPPWLTPSRERLIERLRTDWLPAELTRIHLTCSGSEGVESAIKIALQHHYARGQQGKSKIIGRSVSYHGTTLSATAVGGHEARKKGLAHALANYPRVATPYTLRCPEEDPGRYYIESLETVIEQEGADTIAAFLAEPISGATGGALVPPDNYWPAIRELCDRHDIVLIMDEVMTGFGRTGRTFGFQHWPIVPDILISGKGLTGGYAPLTGVFAKESIAEPIEKTGLDVMFHTFSALAGSCAAAEKVLEIMTEENLVKRAEKIGKELKANLATALSNHPNVAEVRGRGLLLGVEIVKNRGTLEQFPIEDKITSKIVHEGLRRGVFFYGGGTGVVRDILVIGPPLIIDGSDVDKIVGTLSETLDAVL